MTRSKLLQVEKIYFIIKLLMAIVLISALIVGLYVSISYINGVEIKGVAFNALLILSTVSLCGLISICMFRKYIENKEFELDQEFIQKIMQKKKQKDNDDYVTFEEIDDKGDK